MVNAIEIVNPALLPGPQPIAANFLSRRSFDGTTLGSDSTFNTPGTDWSQGRGAFYLNGRIYAGWSNGRLYRWTFNGTTLGPRVDVSAQGNYVLGPTWLSFSDVTGMFWNDGRLYYTRSGDPNLHFRYFTLESELYGSVEYTVSGPGIDGLDWSGGEGPDRGERPHVLADGRRVAARDRLLGRRSRRGHRQCCRQPRERRLQRPLSPAELVGPTGNRTQQTRRPFACRSVVGRSNAYPAGCTFGGTDGRTLFVTAREGLYRVRLANPGAY